MAWQCWNSAAGAPDPAHLQLPATAHFGPTCVWKRQPCALSALAANSCCRVFCSGEGGKAEGAAVQSPEQQSHHPSGQQNQPHSRSGTPILHPLPAVPEPSALAPLNTPTAQATTSRQHPHPNPKQPIQPARLQEVEGEEVGLCAQLPVRLLPPKAGVHPVWEGGRHQDGAARRGRATRATGAAVRQAEVAVTGLGPADEREGEGVGVC